MEKFKYIRELFIDHTNGRLSEIIDFAFQRNIENNLLHKLIQLSRYIHDGRKRTVVLYSDFSPMSLTFTCLEHDKAWMFGGLIYYGKNQTGVNGQFSVRIGEELEEGWSINT